MADLIIKIGAKSDAYQAELDKVKKQTKNFESQLASLTKVSAVAFTALAGTTGLAINEFSKFDNQIRGVKTLLNETSFGAKGLEAGFADMRKEVLAVGRVSAVGIGELNKALFDTVSAGVDAGKAVEVVAITSKLAVAGLTDVATATDGVTSALNAYGLNASEAESVAAKFFAAQVAGKTTISELSSNIGKTAATASAFGVSLDELLGSVSAVTAGGINTASAFTGLNAVFAGIAKPTEDAVAEAKRLGIEFTSTALRSKGLKGFLDDLTGSQNFNAQSIERLFGSVEAQKIAFSLTGARADAFGKNLDVLSNKQENLNTFLKAYETQSGSLENSFKVLGNNVRATAIIIGEKFAPFVSLAAKAATGLFSIMENPIIAKAAALFLGMGVAITGLVTVLGLGAQAFLAIRAAMIAANISTRVLSISVKGLVGATGIGLLLIVASEIFANWSTIWPKMQSIFITFANVILPIAEKIVNFFIDYYNIVLGAGRNFVMAYISIWKNIFTTVSAIAQNLGKVIMGVFTLDSGAITEGIEGAKQALIDGGKNAIADLKKEITNTEAIIPNVKFGKLDPIELQDEVNTAAASVKVDIPVGTGEKDTEKKDTIAPLSAESAKRIEVIRAEIEAINAARAGATSEEINFLKRKNELAIKLDEAKAVGDERLRSEELSLVQKQKEDLLAEESKYHAKKQELAKVDAEKKKILMQEIKAFDDEFKANADEEDLIRIQENILTKDEIAQAQREKEIQIQIADRQKFLEDELLFGETYAKLKQTLNQQEVQGAARAANQLVALQNSKNSMLKGIGKAAALTQIAINTPRGALDAYSSLAGIPIVGPALGFAAAGALSAYGLEQAQQVLSANRGGVVPGGGLSIPGIDSVPASLTPGELVVPQKNFDEVVNATAQARGDTLGLGGNIGSITVMLEPMGDFIGIIEQRQIEAEIQNTGVR